MSIAVGRAAKLGGLVKSAAALERLAGRGLLLLDKTGTLTTGAMRVVRWDGDASLRSLVASVEADSCHPVARALSTGFLPEELAPSGVSERVERHGLGVAARTLRGALLIGSPRLMREEGVSIPDGLAASLAEGERQGATVVLAAIDGAARAAVWLRDEPRDDSAATLGWLLERGWRARILSGDAPGPVSAVARARGGAPRDAIARLSPEEKLAAVRRATSERPDARDAVVMIGDGVNDAAALAAADVGVAVHGGAEASLAAADVYLTRPGLGALADLVGVARRTRSVVRRNLAISLAYNGAAVGLAAAGWITPLVAAVLMPLSSASVLVSAIGGLAGGRPLAAAKNSAADGRSG